MASKNKKRPAVKRVPKRAKPARKATTKARRVKANTQAKRAVRPARKARAAPKRAKEAPMRVVEVSHLPEAAMADASIAPEKGLPVVVEDAHAHVEMEGASAHHHETPSVAPETFTLAVRLRDWFHAIKDNEVTLYRGDAVVGRQKTDTHGEARFENLSADEYRVETNFRGSLKRVVKLSGSRKITLRFW